MSHILVIDDESNIRKMARLTLERSEHAVDVAEDGRNGLALFGDGADWDLVLTDHRMPGLEGLEVTREVRRRDPAARIVMMTSFATLELASDVLGAGATDFLRKPFSATMLRAAVAAALARPKLALITQEMGGELAHEARSIAESPPSGLPLRPNGTPPISYYINGYTYWPVKATPRDLQGVHNLRLHRTFEVRHPVQQTMHCTVAVTPHMEELIQTGLRANIAAEDHLWEFVTREALTMYLWEKAEMPPAMLPIYELTDSQIDEAQRFAAALADSQNDEGF